MRRKTIGRRNPRHSRESGQAAVFLMLGIGLFLLGGIGFAVDMANMWMHRQASQNAADAACTAAAMDMVNDANGATNSGGFTAGTGFNCSSNPTAAPCQYAGFNGYAANGLTANTPSIEVAISFPSSVPGVQTCSVGTIPPPSVCTETGFPANAFVTTTVTDRMQSFFVGLLSGGTTMDAGATASCGAVLSNAPIPILVLNPTLSSTLTGNGTIGLKIVGGPQRSIQVNSTNAQAVSISGASGSIDLSQGGPQSNGSDIGVTAIETQAAANATVSWGTLPGSWLDPRPAISDPFATIPAPGVPTFTTPAVIYGDTSTNFGCPDLVEGCDHY